MKIQVQLKINLIMSLVTANDLKLSILDKLRNTGIGEKLKVFPLLFLLLKFLEPA